MNPSPDFFPEPTMVDVSIIEGSPFQPRRSIDQNKLADLVENIRQHGIQQPPHARPVRGKFPIEYQLVFGHRRLDAAKLAGYAQIPVVLRPDLENDDLRTAQLAHAENADTEPITDADDARAMFALWEAYNKEAGQPISQNEFCRRIGRGAQFVIDRKRMASLPRDLAPFAEQYEGVMTQLIEINETKGALREKLIEDFKAKRLSVRDVRNAIESDKAVRKQESASYTPPTASDQHRASVAASQGSAPQSRGATLKAPTADEGQAAIDGIFNELFAVIDRVRNTRDAWHQSGFPIEVRREAILAAVRELRELEAVEGFAE